jgi:hypothetical protein
MVTAMKMYRPEVQVAVVALPALTMVAEEQTTENTAITEVRVCLAYRQVVVALVAPPVQVLDVMQVVPLAALTAIVLHQARREVQVAQEPPE